MDEPQGPNRADLPSAMSLQSADGRSIGPGATPIPSPPAPKRQIPSIVWKLGLVALVGLGLFLFNRGSTSTDDLAVGDCFEIPSGEFSSVDNQSCGDPHEAQIIARVTGVVLSSGTALETPGLPSIGDQCFEAFAELDPAKVEALPADVQLEAYGAALGPTFCVVESRSGGLVGSLLD